MSLACSPSSYLDNEFKSPFYGSNWMKKVTCSQYSLTISKKHRMRNGKYYSFVATVWSGIKLLGKHT